MHLDQSFAACKSEATKSARNELRNTKIFVVKQKPHKTEKDKSCLLTVKNQVDILIKNKDVTKFDMYMNLAVKNLLNFILNE